MVPLWVWCKILNKKQDKPRCVGTTRFWGYIALASAYEDKKMYVWPAWLINDCWAFDVLFSVGYLPENSKYFFSFLLKLLQFFCNWSFSQLMRCLGIFFLLFIWLSSCSKKKCVHRRKSQNYKRYIAIQQNIHNKAINTEFPTQ